MSTLETNSIGKYNGNNVSFDDAVRLKNYTSTQRDALTSAAGDIIYNSTDSEVQAYDGSSWVSLGAITQGASISVDYLVVGGGGGACRHATRGTGGGGGGGVPDRSGQHRQRGGLLGGGSEHVAPAAGGRGHEGAPDVAATPPPPCRSPGRCARRRPPRP